MTDAGTGQPEERIAALLMHAASLHDADMDQARLWASNENLEAALAIASKHPDSVGLVESIRATPVAQLSTAWPAVCAILGPLTSDMTVAPSVAGRIVTGLVAARGTEPLAMFYVSTGGQVYHSPVKLTFPHGVARWLRGTIRIQAPANYPREDINRNELAFKVGPSGPGSSQLLPSDALLRGALDLKLDYRLVDSQAQATVSRSGTIMATFDFVVK